MKTWLPFVFTAAMLVGACGQPQPGRGTHADRLGEADLVIRDADQELTTSRVAASLSEPMRAGQSLLWCSTLQLAFDALETELGPPLRVEPATPAVQALIDAAPAAQSLDSASYVALAGFGRDDIITKIHTALEETFGGAASPTMIPQSVGPDDILAYAYLFKDLSFEWPLLRAEWGLDFLGTPVAQFGFWTDHDARDEHRAQRVGQIKVLHYADRENWSIEIATRAADDRLIIARAAGAPEGSLGDAVRHVLERAETDPPAYTKIGSDEDVRIPVMNFDVTRSFSELVGPTLTGTKTGGPVVEALQNIRFRLDEKGAVLKSEARIGVKAAAPPEEEREFICDGPFFVLMMRAGASEPYFVGYFATPELLVPFEK